MSYEASKHRTKRSLPFIVRWRAAICGEASPLTSTERLVAFALAQHADGNGASCFPSVESIAKTAALKERATQDALRRLDRMGYVERTPTKSAGQAWRGYEYRLQLPEGPAPDAAAREEVAAPDAGRCPEAPAFRASKARHLTAEAPAPDADYLVRARALEDQEQQEKALAQTDKRSAPEAVFIPLRDGTEFEVTADLLREIAPNWQTDDAIMQVRAARAWCVANPRKRKTRAGAPKFVRGWLARATQPQQRNTSGARIDRLHQDFTQIDYTAGLEEVAA